MSSTTRLPLRVAVLVFAFASMCAAAGRPQHGEITKAVVNLSALPAGHKAMAAVVIEIKDGFHAQSHAPLDPNFIKFEVTPQENPAIVFGPPQYPPGQIEDYPALGKLSVYTGKVIVRIPIAVKSDAKPGPVEITGKVTYQACDDKACYPPEYPKFTIKTQIAPPDAAVKPNEPELFQHGESAEAAAATTQPATSAGTSGAAPIVLAGNHQSGAASAGGAGTVALRFLTAFVVGILFNVVPCVLPVLPLKAVGFYEASKHSRAKSLSFGAVFSLGLISTFATFGILIFVFHTFDWGQLFTYLWFRLFIVFALLALAATTFGIVAVRLPVAVYNVTPRHDTYVGNFLFGILTAVLSTPCTFGMFVGLLAWAISLNIPVVGVLILITVGAGMAFPYLVLSALPEVARRFPRTGPWAELVKQMMGFLLLLAAVYFARPFIGKVVHGEAFWWVPFLVVVAAAAFLVARMFQYSRSLAPRLVGIALALVLVVGSLGAVRRLTATPYVWQPYSDAALERARAADRIALVEFTADWCGNCQYVEGTVLHSRPIIDAVRKHDITMLKADVTTSDAPARPLLDKLNPAGSIPLTVIYAPGHPEPIELTGIYSTQDLERAIDLAAQPPATTVAQR